MSNATAPITNSILLIEDEPSVTAFVRAALERRGYSVVGAASGVEGLAYLAKGSFAGVISDIRMPGSGERIRNSRLDSRSPSGIAAARDFDERRHREQQDASAAGKQRDSIY